MPSWPNHDGSPTDPADDFFPPPPEIGRVRSGTSQTRAGKATQRMDLGLVAVICAGLGGVPMLLLSWGTTRVLKLADPVATGLMVGLPLLGIALVVTLFLRLENQPLCTFVGDEGLATIAGRDGRRRSVFRFADAAALEISEKEQRTNGVVTGKLRDCVWTDASGYLVHRERGMVPVSPQALPPQAPLHFLEAAVRAWNDFQARRRS